MNNMPNTKGNSKRQVRIPANRSGPRVGWYKPMAIPEIANSSGIRQRLTTILTHSIQSY
jgi:hypothetical protein